MKNTLLARLLISLLLISIISISYYFTFILYLFILLLVAFSYYELSNLILKYYKIYHPIKSKIGYLFFIIYFLINFKINVETHLYILFLFLLVYFFIINILSLSNINEYIKQISIYFYIFFYSFVLLSTSLLMIKDDKLKFLIIVILVSIYDSSSYFFGKYFGKKLLIPNISPNKTWIGLAGGVTITLLFALLFIAIKHLSYWTVVIAFIICVLSLLGDITESAIKRNLKIKDTSNILLAHGGISDRIDSYLYVIPFMYFILYILF